MTDFTKYLEGIKAKLGVKSDTQLAIKIGVSQSALQSVMSAGRVPSDETCIKIAELAGDDPAQVILLAHKVKASAASKPYWEIRKRLELLCKYLSPLPASLAFLFILLIIVPANSSISFANDKDDPATWTRTDTALEAAYLIAHYADYKQTIVIARNPEQYHEGNGTLGEHPSAYEVKRYFAAVAIGHVALSYLLPWKPARTTWQVVTFANSARAVYRNHDKYGLAVQLHF